MVIIDTIKLTAGSVDMDCYWNNNPVNHFDGYHQSIKTRAYFAGMRSFHDNDREDRRFRWRYCSPQSPQTELGPWSITTTAINLPRTVYDAEWRRECSIQNGGESAICGIQSSHSNHHEDREYVIRCGPLNENIYQLSNCRWTGYINDFDEIIDFQCPDDGVIRSIDSYHSNRQEDRRWNFECCNLEHVNGEYEFSNIEGYWSSPCEGCDRQTETVEYGISRTSTESVTTNFASQLSVAVSAGFRAAFASGSVTVEGSLSQSVQRTLTQTFNQNVITTRTQRCDRDYFYQWFMKADVSGPDGIDTVEVASNQYLCTDSRDDPECVPGDCQDFITNNNDNNNDGGNTNINIDLPGLPPIRIF